MACDALNSARRREGAEMKALRKRAGHDVRYRAGVEKSVHFFPVRLQQRKLMTIGGLHCRGARDNGVDGGR